jgi:nicotinamidase-related amidase
MQKIKIISVDFQKDFTSEGGFAYKPRPCVDFIKFDLIPTLRKNKIKIAEIISDYRNIVLSTRGFFCIPGTKGYESEISKDVKLNNIWIKCAHSPIWIRKNIGNSNKKPGIPYQDTKAFTKWLNSTIGKPKEIGEVVLIGLTVNCCILSLAQELYCRGYNNVKILKEATDDYIGTIIDKENALTLIKQNKWAEVITWNELKKKL